MSRAIAVFALALALLGGPAAGEESATPEKLQTQFLEAYRAGDRAAALEVGEKLAEQRPEDALLAFDLARLRALAGDLDDALAWLGKSAGAGFARLEILDKDPDFSAVRQRREFLEVRRRVVQNQQAEWRAFAQKVDASPPKLIAPRKLSPDKPAPLIIVLHGRGGNAKSFVPLWREVAREMKAVLALPQGLLPYAQGFQWGSQKETAYQTLQAIEVAAEKYPIDRERVVVSGFSQGGRKSISTAFKYPDRFAGVIVLGSAMDRETPFPSTPGAELPRFFLGVGSEDRVVPLTRRTSELFEEKGIVHQYVVYPGVGHSYPSDYRRQLRRALDFVLDR